MRIAITGHRPHKLGNEYNGIGVYSTAIKAELKALVALHKPTQMISGMALGVDMIWAELAIYLRIPLLAAIPCLGQENRWPDKSRERYHRILAYEYCTTHYVSNQLYSGPKCMQDRNIWMVDNSDMLIAVWDGSDGGTKNCLDYAEYILSQKGYRNYKITVINPSTILTKA